VHRWTWVLLLASACVYEPPPDGEERDDDDMPGGPAGPGTGIPCHSDADPLLCIEFELGLAESDNMIVAFDGSAQALHATPLLVDSTRREMPPTIDDGAEAAQFFGASRLQIDREVGIGVAGSASVEMWIERDSLLDIATTSRLFESSKRLFMHRNSARQIVCGINDDSNLAVDSTATISAGDWHHIACVFDATSKEIRVYIDGAVDDCKTLDRTIDTTQVDVTTAGVNFAGSMDGLHVMPRALTSEEICTNAGRTSCVSQCPINGGSEGGNGNGGPGGG